MLPEGLTPARSSLPGHVRLGRWTAAYAAPPSDGLVWRAAFSSDVSQRLGGTRVAVTSARFPGGEGWQQLPAWLPQDRTVWAGAATWILELPPVAALEPAAPLR